MERNDPTEPESLKASQRLWLLFWGLSVPWFAWMAYELWRSKAFRDFEALHAAWRRIDRTFFSPLGVGLWLLTVGCLLAFMFGRTGAHLPREERLWVLLAIGGGFLAICLRLLGVTTAP